MKTRRYTLTASGALMFNTTLFISPLISRPLSFLIGQNDHSVPFTKGCFLHQEPTGRRMSYCFLTLFVPFQLCFLKDSAERLLVCDQPLLAEKGATCLNQFRSQRKLYYCFRQQRYRLLSICKRSTNTDEDVTFVTMCHSIHH